MDMEIVRLSNASWLRIPDRQAVDIRRMWGRKIATRKVWGRPDHLQTQPAKPSVNASLPVPVLDWPAALFQDETLCL